MRAPGEKRVGGACRRRQADVRGVQDEKFPRARLIERGDVVADRAKRCSDDRAVAPAARASRMSLLVQCPGCAGENCHHEERG
jgi:hypothetical protein